MVPCTSWSSSSSRQRIQPHPLGGEVHCPPLPLPGRAEHRLPRPRLLAAIASVSAAVMDAVVVLLPALADLAEMRSFSKAATLRQMLWHCLPGIARGLGESQMERGRGTGGPSKSESGHEIRPCNSNCKNGWRSRDPSS